MSRAIHYGRAPVTGPRRAVGQNQLNNSKGEVPLEKELVVETERSGIIGFRNKAIELQVQRSNVVGAKVSYVDDSQIGCSKECGRGRGDRGEAPAGKDMATYEARSRLPSLELGVVNHNALKYGATVGVLLGPGNLRHFGDPGREC